MIEAYAMVEVPYESKAEGFMRKNSIKNTRINSEVQRAEFHHQP